MKLNGKPDGKIRECIKPFVVIPQVIFIIISMICAMNNPHTILGYFFAYLAIIFAWQVGWGMSIIRFTNSLDKEIQNDEDNN